MKNRETPLPVAPETPGEDERTIFGEILDWLLAPLLFLWPVGIAVTHYCVGELVAQAQDQALRERVVALAQLVGTESKPAPVLGEQGGGLFRVLRGDGLVVAAAGDLPEVPADLWRGGMPMQLRQVHFQGRELRIAALALGDPQAPAQRRWLVEVGESLEQRNGFTNRLVAGVLLPQFVLIPLAVALVWIGLRRGLRPLSRLREILARREPDDLSPIAPQRVPEELEPLLGAFNALLKRMRRNVEAQQRFVADAAHQLRTPLAGLKMQAQLAAGERDPVALRHALEQIAGSVDRVARVAGQLLTLARTESGESGTIRLHLLDLDRLLRDCVGDWVAQALAGRIDLGYEERGAAPICGDAFLLREMINNLIDNALRYTPAGGRVTCRVVRNGEYCVLEIEDDGIGISPDEAERVFERFYRVDDAHSQGSGLGLAIVREIAHRHGAFAALRPNPGGQGAVARVVFPRCEAAEENAFPG